MKNVKISNLGFLRYANVNIGDLTIITGTQASGKSVFLQMFKLMMDRCHILNTLEKYSYELKRTEDILNYYLGDGMASLLSSDTTMICDDSMFSFDHTFVNYDDSLREQVLYIPAQRILCISDGRPKNFNEFDINSPYVLRRFSDEIRVFFQRQQKNDMLFPINHKLKETINDSFDLNIFHGGKVKIDERMGQKVMRLQVDGASIPFMTWSAGQKEFMPLLMAFYCIGANKMEEGKTYEYVILEEPEMGLHPKAIVSVILQVIELISRGYKVIVSTHSPVLLEFAWALQALRGSSQINEALAKLLDIYEKENSEMIESLTGKKIFTYYFSRQPDGIYSEDISSLDAFCENINESDWGGISSFSSRASDIVSSYIDY